MLLVMVVWCTYCDTECLSKLLDVFKIPLQGFFASGDP